MMEYDGILYNQQDLQTFEAHKEGYLFYSLTDMKDGLTCK
jgi:hypothetical protein